MLRSLAPALTAVSIVAGSQQPTVQIDHIILSINDLERGIADFERMTGVRPVFGGVHPRRGTRNALASLGDGRYLEILAPDPRQPNPSDPMPGLSEARTLTPSGWALATVDTFALQARLNGREIETTGNMPGSRALPDGSKLEWSTFGLARPNHRWIRP